MPEKTVFKQKGIQGLTFGIMEGTILLMGVMLGLQVTKSRTITVIALLVTALADAFANSAGFHVSQETEIHHGKKEVWISTVYCFASTFFIMALLVVPILVFENYGNAVIVSSIVAIFVLGLLGVFVARQRNESALWTAIEYIAIGLVAAIVCFYLGEFAEIIIR